MKDSNFCKEIPRFGSDHQELLTILANCVVKSIEQIYGDKSYKKLFGTTLLQRIDALFPSTNYPGIEQIKEFYDGFRTIVEDSADFKDMKYRVKSAINQMCDEFELPGLKQFIEKSDKIDEVYSSEVIYREHYIHQFQFFCLVTI